MRILTTCLLIYAGASLLHHIHNAEYLAEYPNMPSWLTPAKVYLVWMAEALLGLIGYLLLRSGYRRAGLVLIVLFALFGFAGLDHYAVAPFSAHSSTIHLTIALEVAAAATLFLTALMALKAKTPG